MLLEVNINKRNIQYNWLIASSFIISIMYGLFSNKIIIPTFVSIFILLIAWKDIFILELRRKELFNKIILIYFIYSIIQYIRCINNSDSLYLGISQIDILIMGLIPITGKIDHSFIYYIKALKKYGILLAIILYICELYYTVPGFLNIQRSSLLFLIIMLATNIIKIRTYILLFIICILSIYYDIQIRAHLLNISIIIALSLLGFINNTNIIRIICKPICIILFSLPISLTLSATFSNYNVFKEIELIGKDFELSSENKKQELAVDSRTGVYQDAYNNISGLSKTLFGMGQNAKYKTFLSKEIKNTKYRIVGSSEVGIVNEYLKGGVIGCLILTLIFIIPVITVFKNGKNNFIILLATWISFRYMNLFLDDMIMYNSNTIITLFFIGLSTNKYFINLSNKELKTYINNVIY